MNIKIKSKPTTFYLYKLLLLKIPKNFYQKLFKDKQYAGSLLFKSQRAWDEFKNKNWLKNN